MESIKNKMESLTEGKSEQIGLAMNLEADVRDIKNAATKMENKINDDTRIVSKLEGNLDDTMTEFQNQQEKLFEADKTAGVAELQLKEVQRRKMLLEDETARVNARLAEVLEKLTSAEVNVEENERTMKVKEAEAQHYDEKCTMVESQLEEAQIIAEESHRKQDDAERKLKMVQGELDRVTDKAEEFEAKINDFEMKLSDDQKKLHDLEEISNVNTQKEDNYEEKVVQLRKSVEDEGTRADFSERTVEKLESTVDRLSDAYLQERLKFHELSMQLDQALNDIMAVSKIEADKILQMADEKERKAKEAESKKAKFEAMQKAQAAAEAAKVVEVPMVEAVSQEINNQPINTVTNDLNQGEQEEMEQPRAMEAGVELGGLAATQ